VVRKSAPVQVGTFGWGEANLTVTIRSQVTGPLVKVHVVDGQHVKGGDVLFEIDRRPFEAALRQAEANLARDKAQQENADKEARRQDELLAKGVASQGEFDAARAAADALAASIKADAAAVELARVDLGYCTIRAPLTGRAGAVLVHQGNLVKADDVVLLVLHQVQPILVAFCVPQRELPAIRSGMAGARLRVRVFIPGEHDRPETGDLVFIDNQVDADTGMIRLKAAFANAQQRLWPGQFVTVVLTVREDPDALVVPGRAVQEGQQGQYVFVVKPDLTVEVRPVAVDRTFEGEAVIAAGLEAGEQVVTDGHLRLVPGAKVEVKTSLAGGAEPSP